MNRLWAKATLTVCLTMCVPVIRATVHAVDRVYLRSGDVLEGRVLAEQTGLYTFQTDEAGATMQRIPKGAVMFVHYADERKADGILGLSAAAARHSTVGPVEAVVMPVQVFSQAILEAVREAQEHIYIMAYIIRALRGGVIEEIYDALREKARAGVEVVIIVEHGQATKPSIKHGTRNFAETLMPDGIKVLFLQDRKALHKKMIIVDRHTVLMGSSNLTGAGTETSNEMNILMRGAEISEIAISDFNRMRAMASTAEEVKP